MQFLDLPLDVFRYVLSFIARDFDYNEHSAHEFLRLRLINRLIDAEVLRTLATRSFFKWNRNNVRTLQTTTFFDVPQIAYPDRMKRLPFASSYPEFVASYLFLKPHPQAPWNANFSSFLNYIVDALLSEDGLDINDDESRKAMLRKLCHEIFDMMSWRRGSRWWFNDRSGHRPNLELPSGETETPEFNVLLASLLLRRRTTLADQEDISQLITRKSRIFGTVLTTTIKSGQVELAASLLDTGIIDISDWSFEALEAAIECENHDMLRLVFSSKYNLSKTVPQPYRFTCAMCQAVESSRTDAAFYLLSICTDSDVPNEPDNSDSSEDNPSSVWSATQEVCVLWISEAASRNNLEFVKTWMQELDREDSLGKRLIDSDRAVPFAPLPLAIFYGHKDMIRYLIDWGITCDHGSMMLAAVCSGDMSTVHFLLHEYDVVLDARTWIQLLFVAVQHATSRHDSFIKAVFTEPSLLEKQNMSAERIFKELRSGCYGLFKYACGHGNAFVVQKIAEAGVPLDYFEGKDKHIPPILIALLAGQTTVVDTLLKMGAKPVDIMKTEFSEGFVSGLYPSRWPKRTIFGWACDEWIVEIREAREEGGSGGSSSSTRHHYITR